MSHVRSSYRQHAKIGGGGGVMPFSALPWFRLFTLPLPKVTHKVTCHAVRPIFPSWSTPQYFFGLGELPHYLQCSVELIWKIHLTDSSIMVSECAVGIKEVISSHILIMSVTHSKLNWRNPKVYQTWLTLTGFEKRSHKYNNFETKLKNPRARYKEDSSKRASWNDWII